MAYPIWKDKYIDFGSSSAVDFTIEEGGVVIYSGHAVKRPEVATIKVKINDICADHLRNALPPETNGIWDDGSARRFDVYANGSLVESVVFVNDWSYDGESVGMANFSDPIDSRVASDQPVFFSRLDAGNTQVTLLFENGTSSTISLTSHLAEQGRMGVARLDLSLYQNVVAVTIFSHTYRVVGCGRFVLLYVNAYGGWDTLLMDGVPKESQTYERTTYNTDYATDSAERGTRVLSNRMTMASALHTGWMTDDESSRMHHLMASNEVYLLDVLNDTICPVTITDTSHQVQTYKGNGAKLIQYSINVELAQERIRR